MKATEVITYNIEISNDERMDIFNAIGAVDKGEGGIDDYPILKEFLTILKDLRK